MSEISLHQQAHVAVLHELYRAIIRKAGAVETIKKFEQEISLITPSDIVVFVHELVMTAQPMHEIKAGINKLLNVTYKAISSYPYETPKSGSYLDLCIANNKEMIRKMEALRPTLIALNKETENRELRTSLLMQWQKIEPFTQYYVIKENVLFPMIEHKIEAFKCISVMWSFHDDIRRNLAEIIQYLKSEEAIELKKLNRLAGDLFFNLYAIRFREERLLFPFIEQLIAPEEIDALWNESVALGFPYINPEPKEETETITHETSSPLLDLKTGLLSLEQIMLIFNHLPVDLTYVDEHNKVLFFSTPPHRIFPRTTAIIGRDVKNCHPHESVHVVERIVESFRKGEKDHATFWINMRGQRIMIQYFAVRDELGNYRGVLEASQEISGIQALEGERRILDWE